MPATVTQLPLTILDDAIRVAYKLAEKSAEVHGRFLLDNFRDELVKRAWHAWKNYDASRNKKWENWLRDNLRFGVSEVLREHHCKRKKAKRDFHARFAVLDIGDEVLGQEQLTTAEIMPDNSASPEEQLLANETWDYVLANLKDDRERFLVEGHYRLGMQKREVAQALNISDTRLRQLETRALKRVSYLCRAFFAQDGLSLPEAV